jgi:hypothetical protein
MSSEVLTATSMKMAVFWDIQRVVWYILTDGSGDLNASIFVTLTMEA